MVKRRSEFPSVGELVIGTVKEINPNSIFVKLDEYDKEGMIHISEVASKWVRDIRNWASEGEKVVCKVKGVREGKDQIDLSLKDVSDREKNRRMQSWKRDQRGEEFVEILAEREGKERGKIYEDIGFELQENFKDMLEPFELAVRKGSEELVKRGLSEGWAFEIEEVGEENIKVKEEEVKERFEIECKEPDGIELIRDTLTEVAGENGITFKYISAPEYEISSMARDPKEGEAKLEEAIEDVRSKLEGNEAVVKSPFD